MTAATCLCGAPMVSRVVARLCGGPAGGTVLYDLECSSAEHREQMAAQDRADREDASERALEDALARGLIVPDDTPEAERWIEP